jgi:hypothetical protein
VNRIATGDHLDDEILDGKEKDAQHHGNNATKDMGN